LAAARHDFGGGSPHGTVGTVMEPIRALWIGPTLSVMERLSIASFLKNGHPYHLYVYDEVAGVPPGTVVEDANRILPASRIFQYREFPSYAGFSNYFRYKLLLEQGGYWCDADMVCLKPFTFDTEYVFSSELSDLETEVANCGVIKAPRGSEAMQFAWDQCASKDWREIQWGETGPKLIAAVIERFDLDRYRHPYTTFCPVRHQRWRIPIEPEAPALPEGAYAVHLWNELWRRWSVDKDARYPASCLYERLRRQYLDEEAPAA
jgi:hypothetical protein